MEELTFALIKPNVMKKRKQGEIISKILDSGLRIVAIKLQQISKEKCAEFYREHEGKPFYPELLQFISSFPVILMVLQGDNSVKRMRKLMGDTDPKKATEGTLRRDYGDSIGENAIHGSDSLKSAQREIKIFFNEKELCIN